MGGVRELRSELRAVNARRMNCAPNCAPVTWSAERVPRASSTYWVQRHREAAACSRLVAPWSTGGSSDGARVAESTSRTHASAASFTTCAVTWSSRSRCGSRWSAVSRKRRPKLRAACAITAHAVLRTSTAGRGCAMTARAACRASPRRSGGLGGAAEGSTWCATSPRSAAAVLGAAQFRDRAISFLGAGAPPRMGISGAGGPRCSATTPTFGRRGGRGVQAVAATSPATAPGFGALTHCQNFER